MSAGARVSLAVLFLVLVAIGSLSGPDERDLGETTYGTPSWGFGALYDFLLELELPVERSFVVAAQLPRDSTVWWIRPERLCALLESRDPDSPDGDRAVARWGLDDFVREGGTAVLWLPGGVKPCLADVRITGVPLPARWNERVYASWLEAAPPGSEREDEAPPVVVGDPVSRFAAGRVGRDAEAFSEQLLSGPLAPLGRELVDAPLAYFVDAAGWTVAASLDGHDFVVERSFGEGQLVLVADASFLRNHVFDRGDASLFALDVARAYGTPLFDEREHGLSGSPSTLRFLAGSPAAAVFGGVIALLALYAWSARALPLRTLVDPPEETPSFETYVDSIAVLYARSGDHARVLERYRELTIGRLRRALGVAADLPAELLLARIGAHARVDAEALALLRDSGPVAGEAQLRETAERLDQLVQEVVR